MQNHPDKETETTTTTTTNKQQTITTKDNATNNTDTATTDAPKTPFPPPPPSSPPSPPQVEPTRVKDREADDGGDGGKKEENGVKKENDGGKKEDDGKSFRGRLTSIHEFFKFFYIENKQLQWQSLIGPGHDAETNDSSVTHLWYIFILSFITVCSFLAASGLIQPYLAR